MFTLRLAINFAIANIWHGNQTYCSELMASQKFEDSALQVPSQLTTGRAGYENDHSPKVEPKVKCKRIVRRCRPHRVRYVRKKTFCKSCIGRIIENYTEEFSSFSDKRQQQVPTYYHKQNNQGYTAKQAQNDLQTQMGGQIASASDSLMAEEFTRKLETKSYEAEKSTKGIISSLETTFFKIHGTLCLMLALVIGVWIAVALIIGHTHELKVEIGVITNRIETDTHELEVHLEKLTTRIESELFKTQQSIESELFKTQQSVKRDMYEFEKRIERITDAIHTLDANIMSSIRRDNDEFVELKNELLNTNEKPLTFGRVVGSIAGNVAGRVIGSVAGNAIGSASGDAVERFVGSSIDYIKDRIFT